MIRVCSRVASVKDICTVCGVRRRLVLRHAQMCGPCALAAVEANHRWAWRMERGGDPWT